MIQIILTISLCFNLFQSIAFWILIIAYKATIDSHKEVDNEGEIKMLISNKKYQDMYDRIKALERQNRDLKHQNESLKEENYQLIKSAMSSPFGTVAWKDMDGNIHTTKTQIELDFPNSSKEHKSSGDKIY